MIDEYDIKNLNPRKNPYHKQAMKQITINIDGTTFDYFKSLGENSGISCETLISLYLTDCAINRRQLHHALQ